MALPTDRDIRERGDLRFSERELRAARDSMLREKARRIAAAAREGARGVLNREFTATRGSRKPFDLERLPAEREPSPNEQAAGLAGEGGMLVPDPVPFDTAATRQGESFSTRSPLSGDPDELRALPLTEEVTGDSTVIRTFALAENPYRDDQRALGEPLRDTVTFPSAAKRVREAREEREWSAAELADRAQVATEVVESAERGVLPTPDDQAALLHTLKIEGEPWAL